MGAGGGPSSPTRDGGMDLVALSMGTGQYPRWQLPLIDFMPNHAFLCPTLVESRSPASGDENYKLPRVWTRILVIRTACELRALLVFAYP